MRHQTQSSPSFLHALLHHMRARPEAIFCRQVSKGCEEELTWARLEADCARFSAAYIESGLKPGDSVLIFLRHVPDLYGAFFGAMFAGLSPSFMPCISPRQDPQIYWSSHQKLFTHIRPPAIVADPATFQEMTDAGLELTDVRCIAPAELRPSAVLPAIALTEDDICLLQHSSGTTGLKKGVALSYRAIVAQLESYATSLSITPSDVIVTWLPLYHDMGLIACLMLPAWTGVEIIHLDPFEWVSRPSTLFEQIELHNGTLAWLPNFAFEHLASVSGRHAARFQLADVRAFISCSEVCKASSFERFATAFAPSGVRIEQLQTCYAMAETVFAVSQSRLGRPARSIKVAIESLNPGETPRAPLGSEAATTLLETGRPINGMTVTLHDKNRQRIADDQVGEIALSAPFLFSGYNCDPERTAAMVENGRYFSRDLGFMQDGHLYVLGRLDDLIIVNGRNLYAHEIEAVVNQIDGLKPGRAVAFAIDDPRNGTQSLVVAAERRAGAAISDLDLKRSIIFALQSTFNVAPGSIQLLEEGRLIKTTSGKISRKENAERYLLERVTETRD